MAISSCSTPRASQQPAPEFLYTPCHCPVGKRLPKGGQQRFEGEVATKPGKPSKPSKPKRYRTSRRIQYLAKPKHGPRRPKCQIARQVERCGVTGTQVSRPYQEPYASTRIQQLAQPHVRHLVAAQEEYRRFLARGQQEQLEKRIKKSIFTVYSRLAKVQLPALDELNGMTPAEWQRHRDWLNRSAQPKAVPAPEQPKRERKPLAALLNRIDSLSVPKAARPKFTGKEKPVPAVSPQAMRATPSEHVALLAQPIARRRRAKGPIVEDRSIPETVLQAKASTRVVELATAKQYKNVYNEYRDNPFTVEPNALKAKASDRILELAKPKKVKK